MSKQVIITIDMDDDAHANVHYEKSSSSKKTSKRSSKGGAEKVSKDIFKRIKSVERLVDDVKDKDIDYESAVDEDDLFLFEDENLYDTLTHKTEKQLKRYQAILLGILQDAEGEGEDEEEEEEGKPKRSRKRTTKKSKKSKSDDEEEEEEIDF